MQRLYLLAALAVALLACDQTFGNAPADNPTGGSGGTGGTASVAGEGIPCEVDTVLARYCRECHSEPPKFGAPMALASHADIHAPSLLYPESSVLERIQVRLDDHDAPMPPTGGMDANDRAVLDEWLAAGAPAYDGPACNDNTVPTEVVGPEALDCQVTHTFTAHAAASTDAYKVPTMGAENLYQCFTFKSPFNGSQQGTAWAPIIDDERVLHHWILYKTKTPQEDGGVMPCQMPQDATFVAGWAPGGKNFVMPEDVGLELGGPEDEWLILQMHYHNTTHLDDSFDKSGVALCTTDTPREHLAGVYTLGSVLIDIPPFANGYQTAGMCGSWISSFLEQPLHIIASFPHMHELGTSLRTDIMRGANDGPMDTLVNVDPWNFENQSFYPHDPPVPFNPGDAIRTTCTYDNPTSNTVKFGEKTEDEMCFNFVMLYPIDVFGDNRSCGLLTKP